MECLTIGSSEDLTCMKEKIIRYLPPDSIRSISFTEQQPENERMQFLNICFAANTSECSEFGIPKGLDILMAQWICQKYESRILRQIISSNYGYFSGQDQAKIFRIVSDDRQKNVNNDAKIESIQEQISEYLKTSDKLFLDGFVRFRLKEYREELEDAVEEGVDKFLLRREYDEFIDLLKFFVEIQTPQVKLLHVISQESGKYRFLDEDENDITQECMAEFLADLLSEEITYGDMLLSVLIILAPPKIVWHQSQLEANKELLQTAQMIFGENLTLCQNCAICKNN